MKPVERTPAMNKTPAKNSSFREDLLKALRYEFCTLKTRIRDLIEIICRAGMKESLGDDNFDDVK